MELSEVIESIPRLLVETEVPIATATYTPVKNVNLVKFLTEKVINAGFDVVGTSFSSDREGNKMVGTLKLGGGNEDFGMTLGFRNSYDKSMSIGVGVGAEVFVCSNGMFIADVTQLRKHTSKVAGDLNIIVDRQINYVDKLFTEYAEDVEVMRSKEITTNTMNEIVGGLFMEQKLITGAQLSIIRKEVSVSDNFKMLGTDGNMSLWNLYQNTTEALKKSHVTRYFSDHAKVRELMLDYA